MSQPYQPYGGCESQEYLIECMLVKPWRNIRLGRARSTSHLRRRSVDAMSTECCTDWVDITEEAMMAGCGARFLNGNHTQNV